MSLLPLNLPRYSPLAIAIFTLLTSLLIIELPLLTYSKGIFIYPQDEAYIRMAIGKNLALHGAWGLSGEQFSPASSSLLYPLLLAALYKLSGVKAIFPFLINLAAAVAVLCITHRWLERRGVGALVRMLILLAVVLLTPLPVLVAMGMEHMLQVLLTFLLLFGFTGWLEGPSRRVPWKLFVWGSLLTATRYEGLFLAFGICLLALAKRRPLFSVLFGLFCLLPLFVFGACSLGKGGYFLPASLMIKALPIPFDPDHVWTFLKDDLLRRIFYPVGTYGNIAAGRILFILPLIYWLFLQKDTGKRIDRRLLFLCLCTAILHLSFASAALFFRYEAYLIAGAILVIGTVIAAHGRLSWRTARVGIRWMAVWTGILFFYPFFSRGWMAYPETANACLNTYELTYPAAGFLHRWYDHDPVITDNIGMTSYLSDGVKIDLATGIGYPDIVRSREEGYYRVEYAELVIRREKPALAVISEYIYSPEMLNHWTKVADWYTNNTVYSRTNHLSFYALDSSSAPALKKRLQDFQADLPAGAKAVYP